jgi:beta-glucuronidase
MRSAPLRSRLRLAGLTLFMAGLTALAAEPIHAATTVDLSGTGWTFHGTLDETKHSVTVPHCWPVMAGYEKYIGDAVYEHDFDLPALEPGKTARLHFDAVYYKAHVWLNGQFVGMHEGGYSQFEFDVTKVLKPGVNHLLVEVDNTPTLTTIPSIATAGRGDPNPPPYGTLTGEGIVGWWPYGGIVRPVSLLITDHVYLRAMKIDVHPDLVRHSASVTVHAFLHNAGDQPATAQISGSVAGLDVQFKRTRVAAGGDAEAVWSGTLNGPHLWSVRDPYLYDAALQSNDSRLTAKIGVRELRVQGTQLLLNGRPVHLFGANRVSEDPKEGLRESKAIIERDLSDMLADNMRMMRIAHYPQAQALLDYADAHGMLIIPEAGNWNMSAWQMDDPTVRALWKTQMKEMMEQDWNHPSVAAWSVGNEYESATPQGIAWTRDMRDFTRALDPTRLITFASRFTNDPQIHKPTDEASYLVDFVSANFYGDYAKRLDRVHALWPDKPVFVTEFGYMGEPGLHDPKRIAAITEAVTAMKARPWVIGGSLWTWADYRSLHRGTPADGIRRWGVVTFEREHRDSWKAVQQMFATDLP